MSPRVTGVFNTHTAKGAFSGHDNLFTNFVFVLQYFANKSSAVAEVAPQCCTGHFVLLMDTVSHRFQVTA